ncbi:UvrD-helicase domain-containing protein [Simiduia agarivorans]|uniref:DNA 3'-5' helicase n=1 Tax=Simiduia agarivorans (strain DSM 21679 / JCM 13881 / BCRC 17597 / SA1) TaxID=1117647 RepID=K4KJ02_SIMAS|nr:UvrD-helicase domain-containing protein [Simiduia agarivorans]AFU97963.1 UvrD/REP helicase domain-containing protein [Simiduia agarivorans SA1 = DSM 21679]
MTLPVDHSARERALDPTCSFAVSAPAGSGKTGLLTQRLLRLLVTCEAPEEVLAITFTRKAAGEMRDRILLALREAATKDCPTDPHAAVTWRLARAVLAHNEEKQWALLDNPNRLRLLTIDGLCRQLARQLPFESGLGSVPEPVEQPTPLYRRAVRAVFALLESDHPLADDLALILAELDNRYDTFENLLINLLANRDQWLALALASGQPEAREELEATLKTLIFNNLMAIYEVFSEDQATLTWLAQYAGANLTADGKTSPLTALSTTLPCPSPDEADLRLCCRHYCALADLFLTNSNTWRKQVNKNNGFPPARLPEVSKKDAKAAKDTLSGLIARYAERDGLLALLQTLRQLPAPAYDENQWALLSALSRLLPRLVAELTLVFASEGAADFIDTTQAALRALGQFDQPTDLALRLDYQIRHLLIDEFQDTSAPQRTLVEHLTAGWQPGDGRTLFIVGDGMQSCYGFRNANVGIFLQARQGGIGDVALEPLDLTVNFRSQAGIVDWVNHTFSQAFPSRDDIARGAVAYLPSQAAKPALENRAVRTTLISADNDDDSHALHEAEANAVLERIKQLKREAPTESIALLARNRPHLRATLRLLDQHGIRYQAAELDKLADRMAVQDLVSLLRALLDPTDRISWLAILRAPWCGLGNDALLQLVRLPAHTQLADGWPSIPLSLREPSLLESLPAETASRLARLLDCVGQTLDQWGRRPLRDALEGCWQQLGGPQTLRSAADLTNCQRLLTLVEAHTDGAGIRDWAAFEEAIEQLYAAPDAQSDPGLQVMTIHKSKGLEFDHVLIPGLQRKPRQDERELLIWLEQIDEAGHSHTLLSPISNFEESALYQYIREEKKARNRAEAVRLFYVGCTRAIRQLHLFACVKAKDGELQPPPTESLLAPVWESLKQEALVQQASKVSADQSGLPRLQGTNTIARLGDEWRFSLPAENPLLAQYRGRYGQVSSDPQEHNRIVQDALNRPEASLYEADARCLGTELHRIIEHCIQTNSLPTPDFLTRLAPLSQARLRALCHSQPHFAWQHIEQALLTMAASETGRWLLDGSHAQSATELAIWSRPRAAGLSPRQFIIDRTFVDKGVRWVVDFKSATPGEAQTQTDFLTEQRERYQGQLANYARLMSELGPEPVKSALYFPFLDAFFPL